MKTHRPLHLFSAVALGLALLAGCNRAPARTDAQIASDAQNKIYSDAAVQSRQITVQAANGVVTLSGDVTSDAERTAAANDAGAVAGVKTVINNLQVQQAQAAAPPAKEASPRPKKSASARRHHHAVVQSDDTSSENLQAQNAPPVMPEPPQEEQPAPPPPAPPSSSSSVPATAAEDHGPGGNAAFGEAERPA